MATVQEYVDAAKERLTGLFDEHHALVKPEALARISEGRYRGSGGGLKHGNIDPHHIGAALSALVRDGDILTTAEDSKGGHSIRTYVPANQWKRKTAIAHAAARKRALYARYQGWAQGSERYPQGLIGPAGEAATRSGVMASAALQPAVSGAGAITTILGTKLPGSADSGGFMTPFLKGIPQPPVTVLIEVKNVRQWIYPNSSELYQVLYKCVVLQQAHPDVQIAPILVCRSAHPTMFYMAKQLGFAVIPMATQFVGDVDQASLDEVRNELHFNDLRAGHGPSVRVCDRLISLAPYIADTAKTWRFTALDATQSALIDQMRGGQKNVDRERTLNDLRHRDAELGGQGGW